MIDPITKHILNEMKLPPNNIISRLDKIYKHHYSRAQTKNAKAIIKESHKDTLALFRDASNTKENMDTIKDKKLIWIFHYSNYDEMFYSITDNKLYFWTSKNARFTINDPSFAKKHSCPPTMNFNQWEKQVMNRTHWVHVCKGFKSFQ